MKTDKDIEKLLESGKHISLSVADREQIKATLLSDARASLAHETATPRLPWFAWMFRATGMSATLLFVFLGTTYTAQQSMPGDPLYAVKVEVFEKAVGLTKTTPTERAAYDISLMETRLTELKTIAARDTPTTPRALNAVAAQIDAHVADITETIATTDETAFPNEDKITTLSKLTGVAKAQETVTAREEKLSSVRAPIRRSQNNAHDTLDKTIDAFTNDEAQETVNDFISTTLTDVDVRLHASTTRETVRKSAVRHLNEVDESLTAGDTREALRSALRADQVISVDAYIGDVEDIDTTDDTQGNGAGKERDTAIDTRKDSDKIPNDKAQE